MRGKQFHKILSLLLILSLLCPLLVGCSGKNEERKSSGSQIAENKLHEQFTNEAIIDEKNFEESYIIEHLLFEEGIYEYKINENTISQAYLIEVIVGETTNEEIMAQLPEEIDDYEIDWPKVIGKFAVGSSIILAVGILNHLSVSTYFVFGSPVAVAKDALVGGAIAVVMNEVIRGVKDGKFTQKSTKKYAIEQFAEGYMWGAITSVLKIASKNFKPLQSFKLATGGKAKIKADGSVFDNDGRLIGKAYYDKESIWHLVNEEAQTTTIFDSAGKESLTQTGIVLPVNSRLRLGTKATATICYTDDAGQVFRKNKNLIPNISYSIKGYKYRTDKLGRIIEVKFDELYLNTKHRLNIADNLIDIGKGFAKEFDQLGHLIADLFGGDNTMANIVPMGKTVNLSTVKKIENGWAKCLKEGGRVSGSIKVIYSGSSFRPKSFKYSYNMGDGIVSKTILNK
ncbi:DNA/RNA non-specific endonuclease [Flexilinea flocculi]|uniref:DNA/RNA non-specific endonuclease n=1 Tax=Flexilinea flocculi TaxID=1678840 RepID=A0A0K8PA35_9CHLR|nr:DNA/RNA non-specific endonuclease [Flexilinea flocculi]GAP39518.1 DNA/RNA non-specific endonuclease [Flexilinea flocculi]